MAKTPILAISQVAENQHSKHIVINDAFNALEAASNSRIAVSLTSADVTMTEAVFTSGLIFHCTGHTVARVLTVPATVNSVTTKRTIVVENGGTGDVTFRASATPANTLTLPAGSKTFIHVAGTTSIQYFQSGGSGTTGDEVIFGVFSPDLPDASAEIVRHPIVRPIQFPANFAGARGSVRVNPSVSSATFGVFKNGGNVGSIVISTAGVFTFTSSGGLAVDFAISDILTIAAPNPQNAAMADIGITLKGTKT